MTQKPFRVSFLHVLLILELVCGFTASTKAAGEESSTVAQLPPIVVSASAIPTSLSRAPNSTTVITRFDIEQQQANRLSEILQQIEGLHVDEIGGRGGVSSVYIRGGDPNFTLVLVDGVPMNDPMNQRGGSVDLSSLTPERIDRIEVIRGPLSAVYGSEAVTGVINILTRPGQEKSDQRIRLAGGRFGYTREVLQARGSLERLFYSLSLSHTRNDAQVEGDQFELGTGGWHFKTKEAFPLNIQFTGQYTITDIRGFPEGSGGPRLAVLRDTEKRKSRELVTGLQVSHAIRPNWTQRFSVNFFRRHHESQNPGVLSASRTFQIPPNTIETTYSRLLPRWQHTIDIFPNWVFSGGGQLISEFANQSGIQELTVVGATTDQSTDFRQTRLTGAIFAELSGELSPGLHATVGGRLDMPEEFQAAMSPRVALTYQATPSTRIRMSYGEGFKLPSLVSISDPIIGNSGLQPETSKGWDLSLHHSLAGESLVTELTYFRNQFSDLIDLDPNLAQVGTFRLVNLREVTTQGLELSINAIPFSGLTIKGFLTYLDTKVENSSEGLRNRPKWSGGLIFSADPVDNMTIRGQVRAVGKRLDFQIPTTDRTAAGYVKADLSITYRPTSSWHVFGVVENVTNALYEEFLGFPAPRTNVRLGIGYQH